MAAFVARMLHCFFFNHFRLREDLLVKVTELAKSNQFDYLLIESTGISEPMPVAYVFTISQLPVIVKHLHLNLIPQRKINIHMPMINHMSIHIATKQRQQLVHPCHPH